MELVLHLDKFLSQQLLFTYSLLNHRMELQTAGLQQVSGMMAAERNAGTSYAKDKRTAKAFLGESNLVTLLITVSALTYKSFCI